MKIEEEVVLEAKGEKTVPFRPEKGEPRPSTKNAGAASPQYCTTSNKAGPLWAAGGERLLQRPVLPLH